jgi:hypothetical protein
MANWNEMKEQVKDIAKTEIEERNYRFESWKKKTSEALTSKVYVRDVEEMLSYHMALLDEMAGEEYDNNPNFIDISGADPDSLTNSSFIIDEIFPHLNECGEDYDKFVEVFILHELDDMIPFYVWNDVICKIRNVWWFESYESGGKIYKNMSKFCIEYIRTFAKRDIKSQSLRDTDPEKRVSIFDRKRKKEEE